jgi:hypothetical protein
LTLSLQLGATGRQLFSLFVGKIDKESGVRF